MAAFVVAMIYISRRMTRNQVVSEGSRRIGKNLSIVFSFILPAFTGACIAIMHPGPIQIGAFIPLIYAALYTGMGLWLGQRYVVVGVTIFIATLVGFYFMQPYFAIWMAVVGGGSMILTGLWLRKA